MTIAPIRSMLRHVMAGGGKAPLHLMHAARNEEYLIYRNEFAEFARRHRSFIFEPVIASGSSDERYRAVAEKAERWILDQNRNRQIYLCGVGAAAFGLRDRFRKAGYDRRAVHYEKW